MGAYRNTESDFEFIKECKMYWQGRELIVTNLEISLDREFETDEMSFRAEAKAPRTFDKIGDDKMDRYDEGKACADVGYNLDITDQIVQLDATKEAKLIRKYGLVRDNGTLTNVGKDVILQILLKDEKIAQSVIETLEKLEASK